jgi:hypothetical protein
VLVLCGAIAVVLNGKILRRKLHVDRRKRRASGYFCASVQKNVDCQGKRSITSASRGFYTAAPGETSARSRKRP